MRPRGAVSRWVKLNPWTYHERRQETRAAERRAAIERDYCAVRQQEADVSDRITNTAANLHIFDALPGAIEASEARGQQEVVNSTAIPTDMRCTPEELEALGFKLGAVHADDPMFRDCELPEGWYREGSDHSMWSYICDERGFRRCSIFYKAAFYDRSANIGIAREPTTKAQDESYEAFDAWAPFGEEWKSTERRDGDNLVRTARRIATDDAGKRIYGRPTGEWPDGWQYTGEVRERVIAPDGSVVSEREYVQGEPSG